MHKYLRIVPTLFLLFASSSWANPSIDDFLREADIRDMELSPDGTHLALITHSNGTRTIVVRNISEPGMPVVGTLAGDVVRPNYLYWANDERLLVAMQIPYNIRAVQREMAKDPDYDINTHPMASRMISVRKDMTDSIILMEDERGVQLNHSLSRVTNFLKNDNDHILMDAFRSNRRVQYKVNIETGDVEKVVAGSNHTIRFSNDDDGRPRFRVDYLPRSRAIVLLEYLGGEDWKTVEKLYLNKDDEDTIDTAGLIALSNDRLVYRNENEETGYYELTSVDSDTDERTTLVSLPDQDVRGLLLNLKTDELVGYTIEKDYVRHVYFDEADQKEYDAILVQLGEQNFSIASYSRDGGLALVRAWGPDNPRSYHLWDVAAQQLTLLAHAYPSLGTQSLSEPAMATYASRDGTRIRSYILLPKNFEKGKPHPTVILPHGGPHARDRATYDEFAQFLSTRGYVVVQPNFRGSAGYGRDFELAGYQQWGGVMQDDVTDAVDFVVKQGVADPDKICIVGASYGGYAALMGAVKTPDLFQCAVSINGVTDLIKMLKYDMEYLVEREDWQEVLFEPVGHPSDDKERLRANSPVHHADKIKIPVLLVVGEEDWVVKPTQSEAMAKALKRAKVDHEFIELEETGHNPFRKRESSEIVYSAMERFLRQHLQ